MGTDQVPRSPADSPSADGAPAQDPQRFADWAQPALLAMTRLARRLAPHADADDVVQDALIRAWQKWSLFDPTRGSASTWLLAITADRARAARRERIRRIRVVADSGASADPSVPSPDVDGSVDLDRAIDGLPKRQLLAVHLHYFVGLTVDETASVMACAPGTVKSTLFDARANLRHALGDTDER